uniref:Uncharacterized protein n=2 Tax=cellular organisms TaxID=131567 RepID=A0A7C3YG11_9EURY
MKSLFDSTFSEDFSYRYVILYLMPEDLIEKNKVLLMQWNEIKTLIPCLLKGLYDGNIEAKLHDLDKIFTGIINLEKSSEKIKSNIMAKLASVWYFTTRIFHQSIGPRAGNFIQELLNYWFESSGKYEYVGVNVTLKTALEKIAEIDYNSKSRIDFVLKSSDRVAFVELRMSEHTGGRTGQESLLDKLHKILKLLEDKNIKLKEKLIKKKIQKMDLSIGILFSEKDRDLLTEEEFSKGRLSSLVDYIMEERHLWGVFRDLSKEHGYTLDDGSPIEEEKVRRKLLEERQVCIKDGNDFRVCLNILLGDKFFEQYLDSKFSELLSKDCKIIADDIWLFYSMLINELKVAKMFGRTNIRAIYEELLDSQIFMNFIQNIYNNKNLSLEEYLQILNSWIDTCTFKILKIYEQKGKEMKLLETNETIANLVYLKQICICALAVYITIKLKKNDPKFKECRWRRERKK